MSELDGTMSRSFPLSQQALKSKEQQGNITLKKNLVIFNVKLYIRMSLYCCIEMSVPSVTSVCSKLIGSLTKR